MQKNNVISLALALLLLATPVAAGRVGDLEVYGTLDLRGPVVGLGIINTVAGDTGSISASGPITTINIVGGSGVVTSVSGTTLTIAVGAYDSGGVARLGHVGGQEVYGGTGDGEDLILGSTISPVKGSIILGTTLNPVVEVDEATGNTNFKGTVTIE